MWTPDDLMTDADLVAYESRILTQFSVSDWQERRQKAIDDWLFPALASNGFDPYTLRTRYVADQVWSVTGGTYADRTAASSDRSTDDVPLATIFATPASDAVYIGSTRPFRGLSVRMADAVSATTSVARVALWRDAWQDVALTDETQAAIGKSFGKGGSLTWRASANWPWRTVNGSTDLYYARLTVTAALTAATAAQQLLVIRRSRLCAPLTFRVLELIFREAPISQDGPWRDKADYYGAEANRALGVALRLCGGEFNTQTTTDDVIDATEAAQTAAEAGGGWRLERG